jgi:hypothetical protein
LYALIEAVLPGRVSPYPPTDDVGVRVWIDEPSIVPSGQSSIAVEWPIVAVYDGADMAQVAGLDDLISRIWDACETARSTTPLQSRPGVHTGTRPGSDTGSRRTQTITVRRIISARTLCEPGALDESPVPPEPLSSEV